MSIATKLNVAGLLAAAAGIGIQIVAGVDYPTVPPGLIILVVAAGLVAYARWPWVPVVGVVVPLFLLVGGTIATTSRENLGDPGDFGQFFGTLVQAVGVIVALAAGLTVLRSRLARRLQS
jgi:hypothetical protein